MSSSGVGILRPLPGFGRPGGRRRRLAGWLSGAAAPPRFGLPEDELARLPRDGAVLVVADRALGREALRQVLVLLRRARPDLRPAPRAPWGDAAAREALAAGGALLVLSCARWRLPFGALTAARGEAGGLARLARETEAAVVALHVPRPRRGDAGPRALRLGDALSAEALAALPSAPARRARLALGGAALAARAARQEATRRRVAAPAASARTAAPIASARVAAPITSARAQAPIAARGELAWMEREIAALGPAHIFVPHDRFVVAAARAPEIPALLQEIGRLREITFRGVGEGTGRALDLDAWDRGYLHLFAWDREARELAGAYRLGEASRLLPVFGAQGLYTGTLFDYAPEFWARLGPAVELGRSFVRAEYQRSSGTLLLLWKAIARWVAAQPEPPVLFGAVSMSARYGGFARALVATALAGEADPDPEWRALVRLVTPRRPAPRLAARAVPGAAEATALRGDLAALSALVSEAEPDGAPLPVLVREYAKLGGRFLAWNVDPDFGDTLDGLVVVDLARSAPRLVEFYMGKERAAAFRAARAARPTGGGVGEGCGDGAAGARLCGAA